MVKLKRDWLIIIGVFLLSSLILYSYYWFFHPDKLQWVYQNWDGPSYIVIAKSFYQPELTRKVNFINFRGPGYFTAHFPLYPIFIRLFSFIGYFRSMLLVNHLFTIATLIAFYEIVSRLKLSSQPLLLTLAFVLFPPRWFIVSHVGASESTFMFFSLLMIYFFLKNKHWLAAICGSLAQLTKFQAVHWWLALAVIFSLRLISQLKNKQFGHALTKITKQAYPYLLLPLSLAALFFWYKLQCGNFWQFFKVQKTFRHFHWPPFLTFVSNQKLGIETFWLEEQVLIYILYLAGLLALLFKKVKKHFHLAIFGLSFYLPYLFSVHMDLSRYLIPIFPLVLIVGEKVFSHRAVVLAIYLLFPAIFAHAIGFMAFNLGP
jgi:hypothetical protein